MLKSLSSISQQVLKARRDLELLSVLRSEIAHELSSPPIEAGGRLGDFVVEYDGEGSQDVFLKRKFISGEEIAVSAVLGGVDYMAREGSFLRGVEMKVCVRKPGLSSVLQFNCEVPNHKTYSRPFVVWDAHYIQTPVALSRSIYKGRKFRFFILQVQFPVRRPKFELKTSQMNSRCPDHWGVSFGDDLGRVIKKLNELS